MWPLVASVFCLLVGARSVAAQTASEIVLVEPVRVAFYEAAPPALERSMLKAVREVCANAGVSSAQSDTSARRALWFCDAGTVRFFRGVDVLGNQQRTGLACNSERVAPDLKYYTEDMFGEDAGCIAIAYDVATKRHVLDTEETE